MNAMETVRELWSRAPNGVEGGGVVESELRDMSPKKYFFYWRPFFIYESS